MSSKIRKHLSRVLLFVMILNFFSGTQYKVHANQETGNLKFNKEYINGVYINNDICKELEENVEISNFNLTFNVDKAYLSFNILEEELHYDFELFPGMVFYGENNASIIGLTEIISNKYEVISFRIERKASDIGLMKHKLELQGKTVLHFAIKQKESGKVIYIQEFLENINFDTLLEPIQNIKKEYENKKILSKEYEYIFGNSFLKGDNTNTYSISTNDGKNINNFDLTNKELSEKSLEVLELLKTKEYIYGEKNLYIDQANTYSLFPMIDDSIFQSMTSYNKWSHNNEDKHRPYSYWQYYYMGTNNIATIIVVMSWIHNYNVTTGLVNSLAIAYNETVVYNPTTGALGCTALQDTNPVTVTDAILNTTINDDPSENCFLSLTQGETSRGKTYSFNSIISLMLRWVGNNTATKIWSTWSTIRGNASSSTADTIYFYESPALQKMYYEDGVVYSFNTETKYNLYEPGDGLSIAGATYIIPVDYTCSFSYTVTE